ncbi:ankyrin repeat and SAM domain-containing protein 4B-like [Mercenaria mercenaria]|uniref:ankyrin repeat and SAM domain-containing protein 4B-like n=1 Tax=Mercenaria mercenaria TaxID=6596 RepID=UPI001E1DA96F|nr:ankyrin repeat and SAM domain-containing protein 4B-like [Mercenaria mercenaria]
MTDRDKYHRAARDGYLDILREANRREMNSPDEDGCTPPMLAAQHGNLEALRTTITRGGDVNKMDLLGFTAMHHAARNGHWNCISFLISFGANIWIMDNDMHTALDIAALENREDIVKLLDAAQNEQIRKNPKVIQKLKEKAMRDADNNLKQYERLQNKASKELEKTRRQMERQESTQNGNDFKAPSKASFVKTLTQRIKGNTTKSKATRGTAAFSDLVNGTTRGSHARTSDGQINDFNISDFDDSGRRTLRSVRGTASRKDGQVIYMANIDIDGPDEKVTDNSARPALTNVFPGAAVGGDSRDSGVDESFDDDESTPGMFNRPNFGNISFLNRFQHTNSFQNPANISLDENDSGYQNGDDMQNGFEADINDTKRLSSGTESSAGLVEGDKDLPWKAEDVEELDDEDDDSEYTPVIMFLEGCGLRLYTHLFLNDDVDMDALMILTNQDFQDMGLPIGPRRKLMDAIQKRRIVLNEPAQMYDSQL